MAAEKISNVVATARYRAVGSVPSSGFSGNSQAHSCQLQASSSVGFLPGLCGWKVHRYVSPGAGRVPASAPEGSIGKFTSQGIPPANKGFNRTPVSSAAAKPGEPSGGAG